ncbi:NosD domain-containing protein [Geopsychrobacter electrodiphilus]|uniref:NosD domain-containing protein n=1 Tax=Geopsychrobacter electrodiphilus TaxID=225196 RepID=UPI00036C4C15|nr:right-handed parallel beta-helix repeat-containing protein [Geopsychrobacter electrodiphilus]
MLSRILKLLIGLLFLPVLVMAQPMKIDADTLWQGTVKVTAPVEVTATGTLRIAPGTHIEVSNIAATISVQGQLLVDGTAQKPVIFKTVKGWQGISFVEARPGSRISFAEFKDCAQALGIIATSPKINNNSFTDCDVAIKLLRESSAEIINNHFVDNGLGLGIEMRSAPRVVGNSFSGQKKSGITASNSSRGLIESNTFTKNEQGVSLLQQYPDKIRKNSFLDNRVGLYCYQTQNTPVVEENLFVNNEYAQVNFSFSFPVVKNNRFIKNKTALQNDQFGSALVENNLFQKNATAIFNNRKSNPRVHLNSFVENKLALFVDYSSYPLVHQNNFEKTGEGAHLGIYQSADWEKRSGSKKLVMKNAQARGSKNAMLGKAPTEYTDIVDLSDNWWGDQTSALKNAANGQNLNFFYDRRDKPSVVYTDFGPDSYQLDIIKFKPILLEPVPGAGLLP